jgi:RimJ/RimL family protein N-acetyltransferase
MSKVILGPLLKEDSLSLFKWINDELLVKRNNNYQPIHEGNHENWFNDIIKRPDVRIFSIRVEGVLIGTCQLYNIDWINRNAELQIRIGSSDYRGKGLGKQALDYLISYGFSQLNLNRIYLNVFEYNEQAFKLYEKLNFSVEGIQKEMIYINGVYQDVILMALLKSNYNLIKTH